MHCILQDEAQKVGKYGLDYALDDEVQGPDEVKDREDYGYETESEVGEGGGE